MKRIVATFILTCVLCVSALAGEIPTCNPAPLSETGEIPTVTGDVPTAGSTVSDEPDSGVLTDVLLTLLSLIAR